MVPIPQERLLIVDEGSRIPLGRGRSIQVLATPGHARHHIVFLEYETGGAFVGDAVGIAFPHGHMVQPVTPPPDFDPNQVVHQLRRIAARDPAFLGFAHYGPAADAARALSEAEDRLWEWVSWVRAAARDERGDLAAALRDWVLDEYRAAGWDEKLVEVYDVNTFWPMQVTGIERWLARNPG